MGSPNDAVAYLATTVAQQARALGPVGDYPEVRTASSDTANFRQLVLGCMDSYDSDQRLILQGFSRSTRFAFFCAALNSEILQIFIKILLKFYNKSAKF